MTQIRRNQPKSKTDEVNAATSDAVNPSASQSTNPIVFFDITIGGRSAGRIEMELFQSVVPQTVENFRQLCTGENLSLHFKSSIFHRIIPQFMAQGGDITRGNGTGGESIYGSKFPDENFILRHTEPGLLSMANSGPNTNSSQFFLTFQATPWLDGKHVVFGKVISGKDVLAAMEQVGSESGKTRVPVLISDSGQLAGPVMDEQ